MAMRGCTGTEGAAEMAMQGSMGTAGISGEGAAQRQKG